MIVGLTLAAAGLLARAQAAAPANGPPTGVAPWTRVAERTESLLRVSLAGDDAAVLDLLRRTLDEPGWSRLEREEALYDFAVGLGNLPAGTPGPETLQFLFEYEPQEWVPHDDHPDALVPVFNVRAAVTGAEHRWRRREAAMAGAVLLTREPGELVQAYLLHDDPAVRAGLCDALDPAGPGTLEAVTFIALGQLGNFPELTGLAGAAALRAGDGRALEELLRKGDGAALTAVIRDSVTYLSASQLERLFDATLADAPPATAAMVIAELGPALRDTANFEPRLLALLGEAELGSAAALALAERPSPAALKTLAELAEQTENPLTAARARLALELAATREDRF